MELDLTSDQVARIFSDLVVPLGVNIISAVAILIIGWLAAGWISKRVRRTCEQSERMDQTLTPLVAKTIKVLIIFATLLAVLSRFGFETTSLVALIGAAGLTIGLALQGMLSNVASGVMLLSFRPFETGDFVSVSGKTGIVDDIGLFVTKMHTLQNVYMMLPNSNIWGSEILNYSRNKTRRVDMVFSISYRDDLDKAMEVVREVLQEDQRVLAEPEPMIKVGSLSDSSVDLFVRPWTETAVFFDTQLDLNRKIKQRFDREGITIPFPQRDVHMYGQKQINES